MINKAITYYPYQTFLFVYNLGIFTWLKVTASQLTGGLTNEVVTYLNILPSFFTKAAGANGIDVITIQNFFETSPYSWLVVSMLMTIFYSMFSRFIRFLFNIIILVGGAYFVYIFMKAKG